MSRKRTPGIFCEELPLGMSPMFCSLEDVPDGLRYSFNEIQSLQNYSELEIMELENKIFEDAVYPSKEKVMTHEEMKRIAGFLKGMEALCDKFNIQLIEGTEGLKVTAVKDATYRSFKIMFDQNSSLLSIRDN